MKTSLPLSRRAGFRAFVFVLFAAADAARAQVAPPTSAPPPTRNSADAIVLSPFTVSTDKDEGFVAASSLAGGRLSTDLKDTPLAYSVLTRDFLDALSRHDVESALFWSVGSYAPPTDTLNYKFFNNEGGSSVMSRGIQTNAPQRHFFLLG